MMIQIGPPHFLIRRSGTEVCLKIRLNDFITEPHNYVAVLRAIADGLQSSGEISERVGLASNQLSFYLSKLRDAGFVKREVPISQINYKDSRSGRYFVTDPYLRFYYRFLAAYQSRLALGQQQQVTEAIGEALPDFIEANTWPELCRRIDAGQVIPIISNSVFNDHIFDMDGDGSRERVNVRQMAYIKAPNMAIWEHDVNGNLTGEYFTPIFSYQGDGNQFFNPVAE